MALVRNADAGAVIFEQNDNVLMARLQQGANRNSTNQRNKNINKTETERFVR